MKLEQPGDLSRQNAVADRLAAAWKCEWSRTGPYSPVDVYMMRGKQLVSVVEIRTRGNRERDTFDTVVINLNKWFHLLLAEIVLGLPGIIAFAFRDGIYYARIGKLPVSAYGLLVTGRTDRPDVHAPNDFAPGIHVPSGEFKRVCSSDGIFDDSKTVPFDGKLPPKETDADGEKNT
jgi:hypothetical protein